MLFDDRIRGQRTRLGTVRPGIARRRTQLAPDEIAYPHDLLALDAQRSCHGAIATGRERLEVPGDGRARELVLSLQAVELQQQAFTKIAGADARGTRRAQLR